MSPQRRTRGDGSIYQRCTTADGCPPTVTRADGKKVRPEHSCHGRWFYLVDVTIPGGTRKRRTVSAATLKELRPKITALKKRTAAGVTGDPTTTTLQWVTYWLDEIADLRPTTERTYRGYVTTWIKPHVGNVRLINLTPEHVRSMLKAMEKAGKAPATRKQVLSILSKALTVAMREGKVERNVCDTIARPSLADQARHGVLSLDDVAKALPVIARHENAARWLAALVLGIRQGEALALAWEDVHLDDPEQPWMHIRRSQDGKTLTVGPVKSKASDRIIPVIPPVYAAMLALRERSGGTGLVWGPRRPWEDYDEWHEILKAAKVDVVPVHAARATTASILDRLGATPRQVADILGQSTVHVGQKHYVHSQQDALASALTRVGELFTLPVERPAIAAEPAADGTGERA